MEKPKEKPPEFFKSVKTSLKSILKHPEFNEAKISNVVIKAHKIVIHTLQFMKLYFLYHYETNGILPEIDKVLILNIIPNCNNSYWLNIQKLAYCIFYTIFEI